MQRAASRLACIDLMDRLPMDLVPLDVDDCPVFFCSGFITLETLPFAAGATGRMIAVGQGLSRGAATLACLGEMAERLSVLSRGIDDPLVVSAAESDLDAGAVLAFSEAQEARLCETHPDLQAQRRDGRIRWEALSDRRVRVTRLGDERSALAPSLVCLLREGGFYGAAGAPLTSTNGAAAWWEPEGARRRAVLELIERDTIACWWANRLVPPRLPDALVHDCLPLALADWLGNRSRRTHFLNLPHDLGCPVVAAVSADREGEAIAFGYKAGLGLADAVTGSLLELVQTEMHLQTILDTAEAPEAHPLLHLSRQVSVETQSWIRGREEEAFDHPADREWPTLVDRLDVAKIPVFTFEATRRDLGVPVIRAVSPGLRDWSSRFGPGRLYDLPVRLGLRRKPLTEETLNPVRFVS
ncbi:MAG: YcaO-like family protein [Pseudomonadota bacterium]